MIWIFRFFDFLSIVLPIKIALLISEFLGVLTYCLGLYRKGKKRVIENLKQAGISSCGFLSFIHFARNIGEFFAARKLNKKNLSQWMEIFRIGRLKTEFDKGKGVIVLTGHLGNWELGAAMLSLLGYPTNVVSIRYVNEAMTDFYERRRKEKGLKVIYIEETRTMLKALKRGEILAILGDRIHSGKGVEISFFGKTIKFPFGAFYLAKVTGAPLIPAFAVHEKGRLRVYFEEPIFVKSRGEALKGLSRYVDILEKYIRLYPADWFVFLDLLF